jgi:hypothetical protein
MAADKLTLSAMALAGIIAGSGATLMLVGKESKQTPVEQAVEVAPNELLDNAEPACADEVRQVGADPQCEKCESYLGNDSKPTQGWCCNGAFMPKRLQTCLDTAKAAAEAKAKAVAETGEDFGEAGKL